MHASKACLISIRKHQTECSLSISPGPLIAFGTKVFSLNCQCLVSIIFSLNGLVVSSLIGRLPSEWIASSSICTQSMLVYPRALSSPLYSSSSSSMTCSPLRLLAFIPLLMIPSRVIHFRLIQMTMLPPASNSTETFQPLFSPVI